MPNVPYPYEVNGKLVMGNGSLIPICSLMPSLTVLMYFINFAMQSTGLSREGNSLKWFMDERTQVFHECHKKEEI